MNKLIFLYLFLFSISIVAQNNTINFHRLTVKEGLHDGNIQFIGQDRLGYIWIGSIGALNRYDGKVIKHFTYQPNNSASQYASAPVSVCNDKIGRLWIGFETGLMEFDFKNNNFRKIRPLENCTIFRIVSISDNILYLATSKGLVRYNTKTNYAFYFGKSKVLSQQQYGAGNLTDLVVYKKNLYLAGSKGLLVLNLATDQLNKIDVPGLNIETASKLTIDYKGNIWLGSDDAQKLIKISADYKTFKIYDSYLKYKSRQAIQITDLITAKNGKVWVATYLDGLLEYDEKSDTFINHLFNKYLPTSPSNNNHYCMFQDAEGLIWLGGDINGVNYFRPESNLFQTYFPFPDRLEENQRSIGLAFANDKLGNIWMSNENGVSRYSPKSNKYDFWANEANKKPILYSNFVKALYCDQENNIWIGTRFGVNKFVNKTQKMEFIKEKDLPFERYNWIIGDKTGNIWFSANDNNGIYRYSPKTKLFEDMSNQKLFKKYKGLGPVIYIFEDSKNRIWISYSRKGIVMFDIKNDKSSRFTVPVGAKDGIIGNRIIDINEDKAGLIWVSTNNGISSIDVDKNKFKSYNYNDGLVSNIVSPMAFDSLNRLWLGVSGGIMLLNEKRTKFTLFTEYDGMPTVEFSASPSFQTNSGNIVFPSNNGFISFNPNKYINSNYNPKFYISSYTILNNEFNLLPTQSTDQHIKLKANENSFSLNLVALNYLKNNQTRFAYKLEGFDKNWHFTTDNKAVFTNVPGGEYNFLYKAATNDNSWNTIAEKKLVVKLDTIFYKTNWFILLITSAIIASVYSFYRYRVNEQKQIFTLKSKAQNLEKEKAMVMYESLKQQLNPHFLFNSLTSLSGLIQLDQNMASDFLDQMSSIYRYILKNSDNETVLLKDEIDFAKTYVNLQQTRFRKGFLVNFNVSEEYFHYKITPVSLQNLIENAIKHNVIDASSPLVIDIYVVNDYLLIKNNLQRKNVVETSNNKGLEQLKSLYKYLSEKPIIIEETVNDFTIKIPLL